VCFFVVLVVVVGVCVVLVVVFAQKFLVLVVSMRVDQNSQIGPELLVILGIQFRAYL
jgi:hypothetical protein